MIKKHVWYFANDMDYDEPQFTSFDFAGKTCRCGDKNRPNTLFSNNQEGFYVTEFTAKNGLLAFDIFLRGPFSSQGLEEIMVTRKRMAEYSNNLPITFWKVYFNSYSDEWRRRVYSLLELHHFD